MWLLLTIYIAFVVLPCIVWVEYLGKPFTDKEGS